MAEQLIPLDSLLAQIAGTEGGAGINTRSLADLTFKELKAARASAGEAEKSGAGLDAWKKVLALGQTALKSKSKDFIITVWIIEALVRLNGLPGLAAGSELMTGLAARYWTSGFPVNDDVGIEDRVWAIQNMAGAKEKKSTGASRSKAGISRVLVSMPIFAGVNQADITLEQWEEAENRAYAAAQTAMKANQPPDDTPEAEALKQLEVQAKASDPKQLGSVLAQAEAARSAWRAMEAALDALVEGGASPSLFNVTNLLDRVIDLTTRFGGQVPVEVEPEPVVEQTQAVAVAAGTAANKVPAPGAIVTRDDALKELERVADFFRKTEPHSPIAYTIEEAVRRGRMTLAQLLEEVLPEVEVRNQMLTRLGMRLQPASDQSEQSSDE